METGLDNWFNSSVIEGGVPGISQVEDMNLEIEKSRWVPHSERNQAKTQ